MIKIQKEKNERVISEEFDRILKNQQIKVKEENKIKRLQRKKQKKLLKLQFLRESMSDGKFTEEDKNNVAFDTLQEFKNETEKELGIFIDEFSNESPKEQMKKKNKKKEEIDINYILNDEDENSKNSHEFNDNNSDEEINLAEPTDLMKKFVVEDKNFNDL